MVRSIPVIPIIWCAGWASTTVVKGLNIPKPFAGAAGLLGKVFGKAAGHAARICHQAMESRTKIAAIVRRTEN